MTLPPLHRSAGLYLSWIGGLCGAVVLLLGDVLPFPLPFATPAAFFLCLVQVEVFFALLVWPLFVPSLQKDGLRGFLLAASIAVLLLFALPLLLIGANVSGVGAAGLLRSQTLVAGLALFGAGAASRRDRTLTWSLLAVFLLSTLPPLGLFLQDQLGGKSLPLSPYFSPFWAAADDGPSAWVLGLLSGVAGLGFLARKEPAA